VLHFHTVSSASELQVSSGQTLDSCIKECAKYSVQCSGTCMPIMDLVFLQILIKTSFIS